MTFAILPSLLAADGLRLYEEAHAVIQAGADMLHLDIMDNHYVPNLTFGPQLCRALNKQFKQIPIDVHLMVSPVDELIRQFAAEGARRISIHPEATFHVDRSLQLIRELNCQAGLVLNPATTLDCLHWIHHRLDFVMIMTVNPGFGGQALIAEVIPKIKAVHQNYPQLPICVDGGITHDNIAMLAQAGASEFVAGSAIFNSPDYQQTMLGMRKQLQTV